MNCYGFTADMLPEGAQGIPARITSVHKERFGVVCEYGETYARLKTGAYFAADEKFPTVGDFVLIAHNPLGDSTITATLKRKTFFSRKNPTPGYGEQAVAANFDHVFILQSMNMDFNVRRLERYLTLAWQSGASPVVVLTKADLADDPGAYLLEAERAAVGVPVHAISAKTGYGMEALVPYLQPGKTLVLLGSSGVGKSSLVNAIAGEHIMDVGGIREDDSRGRHTTTHRQLIMMQSGVMLIDTPGMRELGMWNASGALGDTFSDVEAYIGKCRFRDCAHGGEPGCAVRAAIECGELAPERFESYKKLKAEAQYADDREAYMQHKTAWSKGISKYNKQRRKEIW